MQIDDLYVGLDKSNFYLGRISQIFRNNVTIQTENLTLLSPKKIENNYVIPNSINYYVVIDANDGVYFGKIYQSQVPNSISTHENMNTGYREGIFPELRAEILGYIPIGRKKWNLPNFHTAGISDKVYVANVTSIKNFISSVESEKDNEERPLPPFANIIDSPEDLQVKFKPSTLFNKHLMAIGMTGSGKSTTALSIIDKVIKNKFKVLFIDPTGEYSETFSEDDNVKKFILGENAFISSGKLTMPQWCMLFGANKGTQPSVLSKAINVLKHYDKVMNLEIIDSNSDKIGNSNNDFDVKLLHEQIEKLSFSRNKYSKEYEVDWFKKNVNEYLIEKIDYKLNNTKISEVFTTKTSEKDILKYLQKFCINSSDSSIYINASKLGGDNDSGRAIIDILTNSLMENRQKLTPTSPILIYIDEVHRYTKENYENNNLYESGLERIAREGRKLGTYLFLTTQRPDDVDKVVLSQMGSLLIHRLFSNNEIKVIGNFLTDYEIPLVRKLNTGECIFTSSNIFKHLYLKINKCDRKHNSNSPKFISN
ncbi:ATP-binding protein [Lactobacillus mulieris]|uniref:ATP-binding protein n=1 Tax=Lactobacillus mulieris TaxID=2508708 RepID=A0AAW5WYR6_9LACO|nr:ATP-binding protein [Lactobacillus mulieris]MCZ3622321.1 ATP-binding protein [Lactobacillus mulieris]MCZ3622979.1 ATP-binding protein [Lactobacillus mulieris]MCZ3636328.1 ATP-binding protein [Lactobacillus mulieris]MCZ3690696.1 ATP-binding protein [Lactobacillus mulieris]MCZ3696654.1 ATP-binding protein [Lactobacillus mulieris]